MLAPPSRSRSRSRPRSRTSSRASGTSHPSSPRPRNSPMSALLRSENGFYDVGTAGPTTTRLSSAVVWPSAACTTALQRTAFFTRAPIFAFGRRVPPSAATWPHGALVELRHVVEPEGRVPRVELARRLEEAEDLPSLAYAGIPYQVSADVRAAAVTIAWSRLASALVRSLHPGDRPSRSRSPSARFLFARFRFQLWASLHRGSFFVRESAGRLGLALRGSYPSSHVSSSASLDTDEAHAREPSCGLS